MTICGDDVAISYQYCMSGVINDASSNRNHTNGNKTTTSSYSLSDGTAAVAVASQ